MFVRKRDPRYVKETFDEAKLQASLQAASQSQAARAKAAFQENLNDFKTQDWMQVDEMVEQEESEESEVEEEFECIACKKVYKNEKYPPILLFCIDLLDSLRLISRARSISKQFRRCGEQCEKRTKTLASLIPFPRMALLPLIQMWLESPSM